ncbi:MAG: ComEA family DNA-binding protein [Myxococcota bacterium]
MSYAKTFLRPAMIGLLMMAFLSAPATAQALIDVNSAGVDELTQLPGIGPVKARAIIAHREANGPFSSVDELDDVRGIGPATLASIRDMVTVGSADEPAAASRQPEQRAAVEPASTDPERSDDGFDLDLTREDGGAGGSERQAFGTGSAAERPRSAQSPVSRPAPAAASSDSPAGKINLNTANEEELTAIRGIGPAKADSIVAYRTTNGPFRTTEQITEVSGIGPATYRGMRDSVTVMLDLNSAGLEELAAIGLDMEAAERILAWRREHGSFRSVDQITEVPGFGRGALETLRPLLWVAPE